VALIEDLGADRVIVDELDALDELAPTAVFDPLGDGYLRPAIEAAAPGARIISYGTSAGPEVQFNLQTLYRKGMSLLGYAGMRVGDDERRRGLHEALQAVAAGDLRVVIDDVLPLEGVNEAFQRLVERRVRGNLLLALD
jgi:NADPH2:quinone reductase